MSIARNLVSLHKTKKLEFFPAGMLFFVVYEKYLQKYLQNSTLFIYLCLKIKFGH